MLAEYSSDLNESNMQLLRSYSNLLNISLVITWKSPEYKKYKSFESFL